MTSSKSQIPCRHFNYEINTFSSRSKHVLVCKIETKCKRSLTSAYTFNSVVVDHDRVIRRIRFLLMTAQMTNEIVWVSRILRNCIFYWRCTFMRCIFGKSPHVLDNYIVKPFFCLQFCCHQSRQCDQCRLSYCSFISNCLSFWISKACITRRKKMLNVINFVKNSILIHNYVKNYEMW